jgi:hypothetical protein
VNRELEEDEICEDLELAITSLEPLREPEVQDWSRGYGLVRNPSYQVRRSYEAWKERHERAERKRESWLREKEREDCQAFWEQVNQIRTSKERERIEVNLPKIQPEEESVYDLHDKATKTVGGTVTDRAQEYWREHKDQLEGMQETIFCTGHVGLPTRGTQVDDAGENTKTSHAVARQTANGPGGHLAGH